MQNLTGQNHHNCSECSSKTKLGFDFTMAFQPIVHAPTYSIYGHEALVRGLNNESAATIFQYVDQHNRYHFDQGCRTKAIQLAAALGIQTNLSINFLPNAVYEPERCIQTTLKAAEIYQFPIEKITFEITESEKIEDKLHLREIVDFYRATGFKTAIDDFGDGYAGLNLLADIPVDIIKLDLTLIRDIHQDRSRQAIVKGILQVCRDLSLITVAEGVETYEEFHVLQDFGIELFQGYYFARPAFQSIATLTSQDLRQLIIPSEPTS